MTDFYEYPLLHYPDLMLTILRRAEAGPTTLADCMDQIRTNLRSVGETPNVSDEEIMEHLVQARQRLLQVRAIEPVGQAGFRISPRGRSILAENPTAVDDTVLMHYPEFEALTEARPPASAEADPRLREFDEGYQAFRNGRGFATNPYRADTVQHLAWENGWSEARDEALEDGAMP